MLPIMSNREKTRRRAGRPPAGAKDGEKVTDYPQLSVRVPHEMKNRLNALSVVTGLAQWRIVVEALESLDPSFPKLSAAKLAELAAARKRLEAES